MAAGPWSGFLRWRRRSGHRGILARQQPAALPPGPAARQRRGADHELRQQCLRALGVYHQRQCRLAAWHLHGHRLDGRRLSRRTHGDQGRLQVHSPGVYSGGVGVDRAPSLAALVRAGLNAAPHKRRSGSGRSNALRVAAATGAR